jgi:hypothetical protein
MMKYIVIALLFIPFIADTYLCIRFYREGIKEKAIYHLKCLICVFLLILLIFICPS